MINVVLGGGFI